jgi:hypothetical protein
VLSSQPSPLPRVTEHHLLQIRGVGYPPAAARELIREMVHVVKSEGGNPARLRARLKMPPIALIASPSAADVKF